MKKAAVVLVMIVLAAGAAFWQWRRATPPAVPAAQSAQQATPATDAGVAGQQSGHDAPPNIALPGGDTPANLAITAKIAGIRARLETNSALLVDSLFQAAAAGDIYAVRDYVAQGAPLNERGPDGMTPFLAAAKSGNAHILTELLNNGADSSIRDAAGNSAVHLAVLSDNVYTLRTLVDKGVPLLVENDKHYTPLHSAASTGALESITFLSHFDIDFMGPVAMEGVPIPVFVAADAQQWAATQRFIDLGYDYYVREAAAFGDLDAIKRLAAKNPQDLYNVETRTQMSALLRAVGSNHMDVVIYLLDHNVDMYHQAHGYDPMGLAIVKELRDFVKLFLDRGYDPNRVDQTHESEFPLHLAVRKNMPDVVQLLVEHGSQINAPTGWGLSALHIAVIKDHLDLLPKLVELGADVNIADTICRSKYCDVSGTTPLHLAITMNKIESARLLVELGADIDRPRKNGETSLHLAAKDKSGVCVDFLLEKGANIASKDEEGRTPLHAALLAENSKAAEALLGAGADIEIGDNEGLRALHLAAKHGLVETAKNLLALGAEIEARDHLERTPLYVALEYGQEATAQYLIDQNADLTVQNREKRTLLFPAIASKLDNMVVFLAEHGLDVNHADYVKNTPLHIAAQDGTEATLNYLLKQGADPNAKDRFDQTALHFAAGRGYTTFVRDLILAGAEVRSQNRWGQFPIHMAAQNGHWGAIHYFLIADTSLSIDTPDTKGNTPLHMAIKSGMPALVEILIERGADILSLNERGYTPLSMVEQLRYATIHPHDNERVELKKREGYRIMTHFLRAALYDRLRQAVIKNDLEGMRQLLEREPSLLNVMVNGETPLHVAARLGQKEALELLIEMGAHTDVVSRTSQPGTAAELAQRAGHTAISELLAKSG